MPSEAPLMAPTTSSMFIPIDFARADEVSVNRMISAPSFEKSITFFIVAIAVPIPATIGRIADFAVFHASVKFFAGLSMSLPAASISDFALSISAFTEAIFTLTLMVASPNDIVSLLAFCEQFRALFGARFCLGLRAEKAAQFRQFLHP